MNELRMGEIESRFADIIWTHEPLSSGELVKLCESSLAWKKPTTYTVLRKLCEKGYPKRTAVGRFFDATLRLFETLM